MSDHALRRNIHTGDMDRLLRIRAAVVAQELGLPPEQYALPFPGNSVNIQLPPDPPIIAPARKGLSKLAGLALLAAGAAIPGVGIAGYLLGLAKPALPIVAPPVVKTVEKIIEKPGKNYGVDVDVDVIPPP